MEYLHPSQITEDCARNLSLNEINKRFGTNEEEIKKCDDSNCPYFKYNNGMLECTLLSK